MDDQYDQYQSEAERVSSEFYEHFNSGEISPQISDAYLFYNIVSGKEKIHITNKNAEPVPFTEIAEVENVYDPDFLIHWNLIIGGLRRSVTRFANKLYGKLSRTKPTILQESMFNDVEGGIQVNDERKGIAIEIMKGRVVKQINRNLEELQLDLEKLIWKKHARGFG